MINLSLLAEKAYVINKKSANERMKNFRENVLK